MPSATEKYLQGIETLQQKYGSGSLASSRQAPKLESIVAALVEFMECVRYLNTRRSDTTLTLDSEAAVQDALFLMLRPFVRDLVPETPSDKVAGRYSIKDFRSKSARTIVEAKYVRDRDHGRSISREIHDDIEIYRTDALCDNIVFFIYDPDVHIPDKEALRTQVEIERKYSGRLLRCRLVLQP